MENIYRYICSHSQSGQFVKATVITSEGSAPGKPGSSAIFTASEIKSGTIGGGLVEESVRKYISESWPLKKSVILSFNLDYETIHAGESICGGRTEILADATLCYETGLFENIKDLISERKPAVLVSVLCYNKMDDVNTDRYLVAGQDFTRIEKLPWTEEIMTEVRKMLENTASQVFKTISPGKMPDGRKVTILLEGIFPPPRLIIAGAGHVGKALCHLGKFLGFSVTVIDDRKEFANSINLPEADEIITDDIGSAVAGIQKDSSTYIVIVTRGHAKDAEALRACIGSKAAYIGMIGSRTKTEKIKRDFLSAGWATSEQWAKIHAPVGISINSKTVEEIALSIAAELVLVKNRVKNSP